MSRVLISARHGWALDGVFPQHGLGLRACGGLSGDLVHVRCPACICQGIFQLVCGAGRVR
eukprot:3734388-Pleurochrysis_carterae.AAC.1